MLNESDSRNSVDHIWKKRKIFNVNTMLFYFIDSIEIYLLIYLFIFLIIIFSVKFVQINHFKDMNSIKFT